MKTGNRDIRVLPLAILLSMLVNITLFSFQPMISRITSSGQDLDRLIPIKMFHLAQKPDEPIVPEIKQELKPEPLMSDDIVPQPVGHDLELSLPRMQFNINPVLSKGVPISVPDQAPQKIEAIGSQPQAFSIADVDQPPSPLFQLKPEYPNSAKRSNVAGKVSVMFLVDQHGNVLEVRILNAEPEGVFEDSVRSALTKWKFMPGKLEGKNVKTWVSTTIRFELD
ncbi:MAG: TonB family protein [Proteobacteria bacterium]|nr:TonB family protein [Pseudomonadota bacterium]MBU1687762.1 TonB family protein [Pseudomonadota bacterium]